PNMRPAISPELRTFQNCLEKYLKGQPVTFPLELLSLQQCSLFQQSVYQVTAAIPWGQVATYKEIAGRLGKPGASQAVGQALARNHFPLVIPCHRVVKSDGQTGGFSSGLQVKKILLRLEGWK
ncbi:MAG TPA: MGMT family protein, partial [bacterium]|nr:MGMT family protein [bacterium]